MRVKVVFEIDRETRVRIGLAQGLDRPATYEEVKTYLVGTVLADMEALPFPEDEE